MALVFSYMGQANNYDINFVKSVYAAKQTHGTTVISTIQKGEEAPTDSVVMSGATGRSSDYHKALARDYIEGRVTSDEFVSHMEDLFYGMCYDGVLYNGASQEIQQYFYEHITALAYNGVLDYYLMKNADEWSSSAKGADFYYNSDYHYEHLQQIPALLEGFDKLAAKLGVESNLGRLNNNIRTVNGRMSAMLGTKCGVVASLDEVPPEGFKMKLYTGYDYSATIEVDGKTYTADIPFSYDDYTYKFKLAELLLGFDIPEKYMAYINNISVVNQAIAHFYRGNGGTERTHGVSSEIFKEIKGFEAIAGRAIAAYDANATEKVVLGLIDHLEYQAKQTTQGAKT